MSPQFTFECVHTVYCIHFLPSFFHFHLQCQLKPNQNKPKEKQREKTDRSRFKYVIGSLEAGNSVYRFGRRKNPNHIEKRLLKLGGAFQLQFTWLRLWLWFRRLHFHIARCGCRCVHKYMNIEYPVLFAFVLFVLFAHSALQVRKPCLMCT